MGLAHCVIVSHFLKGHGLLVVFVILFVIVHCRFYLYSTSQLQLWEHKASHVWDDFLYQKFQYNNISSSFLI